MPSVSTCETPVYVSENQEQKQTDKNQQQSLLALIWLLRDNSSSIDFPRAPTING